MSQKIIDGCLAEIKKAEEQIKALNAEYAKKQEGAAADGKVKIDKIESGKGKEVQSLEVTMNTKREAQESAEEALNKAKEEYKAAKDAYKLAFKGHKGALKDQTKENEAVEKNLDKELSGLLKEQKNLIKIQEKSIKAEEKIKAKLLQSG
ncbi:MAG: hypothetical protein ACTSYU_00055 [Promethearchaeota archaeon]